MRKVFTSLIVLVILVFVIFAGLKLIHHAPRKHLWPRWQVFNPLSSKTINYQAWNQFLQKYVHTNPQGINLVNYAGVTEQSKQNLTQFINYLSSINIRTYNRNVQEAYWINLYNALTVQVVLQHYPVKSILDINISPGIFSHGPWDRKLVRVDGVSLTLNDIEHRILRPIWNDPRIHYTVNCASYSCPNLRRTAYTGANIKRLLNVAARQYINSPRAVEIKNGKLIVSSIFKWYKKDFGGSDQYVIDHLMLYANPSLKSQLAKIHHISGYRYNWKLNQTAPTKK